MTECSTPTAFIVIIITITIIIITIIIIIIIIIIRNNARETILTIQLQTVHSLDYLQHYTQLTLYCANYLHHNLNYNAYTTYSTLLTNTIATRGKEKR